MARLGGWDSPGPGRTRMQSGCQPCWVMLESGTGSARPFTSEPEVPQGEEGAASRASRHGNAEALVSASFFSSFYPIFRFKGGGVSGNAWRRHPSRPITQGTQLWRRRSTKVGPGIEGCRQPQTTIKYGGRHPTA